jgi:RNA polymerase sigma-70 factor (ECF subfamily)
MAPLTSAHEDLVWIKEVLAGHDDAYSHLVKKYRTRIYGLVSRFTHQDQELDDLAQEVFIRAYRKLAHFRGEAPFEHWLLRIATNCCYSWLRKHQHRRKLELPVEALPEMVDTALEHSLAKARIRELLETAFSKLSTEERLIITLLELEDKSVREIALLTGWSESNVKTRAHRARHALAKILEKQDA